MNGYRFVQVDAFAARAFTGNPAAVMPLDAWPDDATLQAIAAENNLAETAFLVPCAGGPADDEADHELRWFSPRAEVAMCGHATLAAGHVLLGDEPARARVRFATRRAGILEVARAGDGYSLSLPALMPASKPLPEVAAALGVVPLATLWHPQHYAVVVADPATVIAARPDFAALARFGDWLTILTAHEPEGDGEIVGDIVTRAFAPGAGVDEDPVTGSAHAVIVPYWAARLGRTRLAARQASARGGRLACTLAGDRVILEGGCVTVIEGVFRF